MRRLIPVIGVVAVGLTSLVATSVSSAPVSQPWHLDRINQRTLPLDGNFSMGPLTGQGVSIYVVDSGVNLAHEQFGPRAIAGIDPVTTAKVNPVSPESSDCNGHGTHVAALAGGSSVGVAPAVTVVSVRVLDCDGEGQVSYVVAALKWIRGHHVGNTPAIVNLSLGVDIGDEGSAIDYQVRALLAEGVVVTIAAGNGDSSGRYNSCDIAPAHVEGALTVGAVAINDVFTAYSGFGPCVDILAPGGTSSLGIESAWIGGPSAYDMDAGTSMASPLVAGFAAQLLQQQPGLCPNQVSDAIVSRATTDVVTELDVQTANRLLFIDTTPVAPGVPGMPSNVITSTQNGVIRVSWDMPCDGGAPITSTRVSLLKSGRVIKKLTVAPGVASVRFGKLVNGTRYSVEVQATNALGDGIATPRLKTPVVRPMRRGQIVPVASVARFGGDLTLKWRVLPESSRICRLISGRTRIQYTRSGICRVALRTITNGPVVTHSIKVS
jgi:subtilisin family serine protease